MGSFPMQSLDFASLLNIWMDHETEHAKKGIRTGRDQLAPTESISECHRLIWEFQAVLKEQQSHATGSGLERAARWMGSTGQLPETGNVANAALTAKEVVKKISVSIYLDVVR
jgi:hypothetical protein